MSRISGFRERDFSRSGPPSPQRWAPAVRSKLAVPALEAGARLRAQVGATTDGGPYVAVNVSPIQLQDPSHVRALRDAVERSRVPAEKFTRR